jgi:hypothetical protein
MKIDEQNLDVIEAQMDLAMLDGPWILRGTLFGPLLNKPDKRCKSGVRQEFMPVGSLYYGDDLPAEHIQAFIISLYDNMKYLLAAARSNLKAQPTKKGSKK